MHLLGSRFLDCEHVLLKTLKYFLKLFKAGASHVWHIFCFKFGKVETNCEISLLIVLLPSVLHVVAYFCYLVIRVYSLFYVFLI